MKKLIIFTITILLALATYAEDKVYKKSLNLDAASIKKIDINCGSGMLKIKGIKGLKEITVKAEIVMKDDSVENYEKYIDLYLKKKGKTAVLKSDDKQKNSLLALVNRRVVKRIDLEVKVPAELSMNVDDGSGSIEISNIMGDVEIEDGSGSMVIDTIGGKLKIDDGSGSMRIDSVKGDIDIEDGSGSMTVYNTGGNVVIDDGSGSIKVKSVEGDVIVKESGSGSVSIKEVKGKVVKDK